MATYEIRYKLTTPTGKYFFRRVEASTQWYANQVFDNEMPNAHRCGSARRINQ